MAAYPDADEVRSAIARATYVRVSPMKARRVVDLIRNLPAQEALSVLKFAPQAASEPELPAPAPPHRVQPSRKKRPTARHPASSPSAPDQPDKLDDKVPCDPLASPGGC